MTLANFKLEIENGRLCSTVGDLQKHFNAINRTTNLMKCEVGGEKTVWRCVLCDKYMCTTKKRNWNGSKCIFSYHSPDFFGLVRSDHWEFFGKHVQTWKVQNEAAVEKNARKIRRWMNGMGMEETAAVEVAVAAAAATGESES